MSNGKYYYVGVMVFVQNLHTHWIERSLVLVDAITKQRIELLLTVFRD